MKTFYYTCVTLSSEIILFHFFKELLPLKIISDPRKNAKPSIIFE